MVEVLGRGGGGFLVELRTTERLFWSYRKHKANGSRERRGTKGVRGKGVRGKVWA